MEQEQQPVLSCEEKLKCVLDLILRPEFSLQNDTYFDKLLSHLSSVDIGDELLQSQTIITWIPTALHQWESTKLPNLRVCSFLLNLTALVSHNETTFVTYSLGNMYDRLFDLFKMQEAGGQPTIKLAYVRILSSFLNHRSGIEWIISNSIWKDCLGFCLDNETIYIIKEGHNFIYNLIVKTVEMPELFCAQVVQEIYGKLSAPPRDATEGGLEEQCAPTLRLVIFILHKLIEEEHKQRNYRAVSAMLDDNALEEVVKRLIPFTNDLELVHDLHAIKIYIKIFQLLARVADAPSELYYQTGAQLLGIINELLCVRYIPVVIRLCHLADLLWTSICEARGGGPAPPPPSFEPHRREPLRFQNQLLCFEVSPIFGICFIHVNSYKFDDSDDLREDFITSFFRMLAERTIRMGYNWRECLYQQEEAFQMAKFAALHVLRSIDNYNKSRAIVVFQVLLYTFKDILAGLKEKPHLIELFVQHDSFMISLFETMAAFINKYEISWRDSVETICVMNNAIECINQPFWPPRVIVQALKLVELSIAKFLPPDLALLVEEDSTTNMLASMLTAKLYDVHWEIRDSTLEILHTIANISHAKYPLFQKMLLNVDIIPMVVTMTTHDSEGFVRAAAIKCLQEMIKVHEIWSQMLVNQELPQKMMHILKYEPEAIVRTEAAKLMANIHEYQFFQNEMMPEIYESMSLASAKDLHWEVKSSALDFWGKVVLNHLQEQGYIDHKFPNVTFSKEQRKIVTLNEEEVQRRLGKVLRQLSANGCLGVLAYAIQEDCDLEVSKKALRKVKKMKRILEMHSMLECYDSVPMPVLRAGEPAEVPMIASTVALSDDMLDNILDTSDAHLLQGIFTQEEPAPLYAEDSGKVRDELLAITPEIFITFIQKDLDAMINEKTNWLNKLDDFESLLDDMRKSYDVHVNSMDCY